MGSLTSERTLMLPGGQPVVDPDLAPNGAIDGALELAEIQGDYAIDEIGIFDGESVTKAGAGGTPTDD